MKPSRNFLRLFSVAAAFALPSILHAGGDYQVTGEVKEMTDTKIVVVKGKENFEMARTAGTKVTGEPKVGSKVTVHYTISATEVESKDKPAVAAKPAATPAAKAAAPKK